MRNKKRNRIFLLLILLLGIGIGFAALSTTLKINGNAVINKNTWSVYWNNIGNIQKSETTIETSGASVDSNDDTLVSFNVTLNQPGDFYEFQVDAVNEGTLDAMVKPVAFIINNDEEATLPSYLNLSIKYLDDTNVEQYHLLPKADTSTNPVTPTVERFKVRIELSRDISEDDLADIGDGETYDIALEMPYVQADEHATDRHPLVLGLGDYFTLVPDAAQATTSIAGFSGSTPTADQTLWRVIDVHQDGSVDAVSEYVSSEKITVRGSDFYKNYVAGLQDIASKYAKAGYTTATRCMGYDGQTDVLQNASLVDGSTSTPGTRTNFYTPVITSGTGQEYNGGAEGDTLYIKDYLLVSNVYNGDLRGQTKSGDNNAYFLASRKYSYDPDWGYYFQATTISGNSLGCITPWRWSDGDWYSDSERYSIRPIITVKSGLYKASGTGVKTDPYIFK